MKEILAVTIGSTMLLLASSAFAQDGASEWTEGSAAKDASEDTASAEQPPEKKSKKKKKKKKKTIIVTEGQGTTVDDDSGQTVIVVNQAPGRYPAPPPPPPPPPRRVKPRKGVYTHDGFYFRGGLDLGAMVLMNASSSTPDASIASFAAGMNFGFGGTLGKGLVLGGRLDMGGGSGPKLHSDGKTYDLEGGLVNMSLQLFGDWYIFPKKGLHVEAGIGAGLLGYDPTPDNNDNNDGNDNTPNDTESIGGATGILGAGYDWWVGEQWSLGVLLRLNWGVFPGQIGDDASMMSIKQQDGKGTIMMLTPVIGFTVTYH